MAGVRLGAERTLKPVIHGHELPLLALGGKSLYKGRRDRLLVQILENTHAENGRIQGQAARLSRYDKLAPPPPGLFTTGRERLSAKSKVGQQSDYRSAAVKKSQAWGRETVPIFQSAGTETTALTGRFDVRIGTPADLIFAEPGRRANNAPFFFFIVSSGKISHF